MELENEEEVLDEYDIIYVNNMNPLNVIQYPLMSKDVRFYDFFNLEEVNMKPLQNSLEFKYAANKSPIDNFNKQDRGEIAFESKYIRNRTYYCVGYLDKASKSLLLFPIEAFYQMRRSFSHISNKEFKLSTIEKRADNMKIEAAAPPVEAKESDRLKRERDMKNRLDYFLRSHNFQEEVLGTEPAQSIAFFQKDSKKSSALLNALLDPPKRVLDNIKPLTKDKLIRSLEL